MRFEVSALTDVGRRRPQNEDAYLADPPLIAVADGMGGHSAGEVASQLTLEVLAEWKSRLSEDPSVLPEAAQAANERVWERGKSDDTLTGMGTTLTAAWLDDTQAFLAHVGDTRAYLLRDGSLSQLTEDQTVVHQMEKEGKITAEEAASHPSRHMLLQAIGSERGITVDVTNVELQAGDRLLLSSDGLHGLLDDARIEQILNEESSREEACRRLVDEANEASGKDNITVVIADVLSDEQAAPVPPPEETRPIVVSKPARTEPSGRRGPAKTLLVAGAIVAGFVLVAGIAMLVRSAANQVFIGVEDGNVAILRGTPGQEDAPPEVNEVVDVYEGLPPAAFAKERDIRAGTITAPSVADARRAIEHTLRRRQGPEATPTPSPPATPTPAATPQGTLPPTSPQP